MGCLLHLSLRTFFLTALPVNAVLILFIWYYFKSAKKDIAENDLRMPDFNYGKASYDEILHSLKNQHFLINITNYLNGKGDFRKKVQKTLSILGQYTKADSIFILEEHPTSKRFLSSYEWCTGDIESGTDFYQKIYLTSQAKDWKNLFLKDGVVHYSYQQTLPEKIIEIFKNREITSLLAFPLHIYNRFFGYIAFENKSEKTWSDMDVEFLKTVSLIVANAFEKSLSEQELRKSEKKFRDIFNYSSDFIFIYNYHGELIELNNRACEMLQQSKDMLVKQNIEQLFPPERIPKDMLYQITEPNEAYFFESEFVNASGTHLPVELNCRPIIFNNKELILCQARDISGRKEMQREILSAIIGAEEKERGRIARDLHDGMGPLLSSLKLYAKVLGTTTDPEKKEEMLKTTMEVVDESMVLTKEILNNLSPHVLNDFGLASAIHSFCKKITFTKAIEIKFDSNVFEQRFDTNVEIVIFRVLKELVNNTIKHALATRIDIFLLRSDKTLSLVYSDNGIGFDVKKVLDNQTSGMGISNIVNRIRSINGRLMFESHGGKGIQIKIEVELKSF